MPMQPATQATLNSIAQTHGIRYEQLKAKNRGGVATRMSRTFNVPQEELYNLVADLASHPRFFPHLKQLKVITNDEIGNVLNDNQFIVVEGMEEGGSKLGVKRFTLTPPQRIDGHLLTDPFPADGPMADKKQGNITWSFEKVNENSSNMTVESEFVPTSKNFYIRGLVDHVWLNFFENVMVHLGELPPDGKMTQLFA